MYFEFNYIVSTGRDNSVGKVTTLMDWTFEESFFDSRPRKQLLFL